MTLGSPLGVKSIQRRLEIVEMPTTTASWHNARDVHDVVALYPLTKEYFATQPAIENYNGVDNKTENQHGIVGYLPDDWVTKAIYTALIC